MTVNDQRDCEMILSLLLNIHIRQSETTAKQALAAPGAQFSLTATQNIYAAQYNSTLEVGCRNQEKRARPSAHELAFCECGVEFDPTSLEIICVWLVIAIWT